MIWTFINIAIKIVHSLYEAYFICKYLFVLYTSMIWCSILHLFAVLYTQ